LILFQLVEHLLCGKDAPVFCFEPSPICGLESIRTHFCLFAPHELQFFFLAVLATQILRAPQSAAEAAQRSPDNRLIQ
jgi:hypothetical protein